MPKASWDTREKPVLSYSLVQHRCWIDKASPPVSVMLFGSCHLILFVSSTNYFQMVRRQCCLVLNILTPFSSSWTPVHIIRAVIEHGNAINTKRSYPPCWFEEKAFLDIHKNTNSNTLQVYPHCHSVPGPRTRRPPDDQLLLISSSIHLHTQIAKKRSTNTQIYKNLLLCEAEAGEGGGHGGGRRGEGAGGVWQLQWL